MAKNKKRVQSKAYSQIVTKAEVAISTSQEDVLLEKYPFYVPVRYSEHMRASSTIPYDTSAISLLRLYMCDWLQFCAYVNDSKSTTNIDDNDETIFEQRISVDDTVSDNVNIVVDSSEMNNSVDATNIVHENNIDTEVNDLPVLINEHVIDVLNVATFEQAKVERIESTSVDNIEDLVTTPVSADDYFRHQGEIVSSDLPDVDSIVETDSSKDKKLMVMMSFAEWLTHFKKTSDSAKEEDMERKALKSMWQKEKLAAAIEEENEEIPDNVFQMAVNSIAKEDGLASESLAEIYVKQGKPEKAIEMYKKLSLRNPQKNQYFASKIEELTKIKQS